MKKAHFLLISTCILTGLPSCVQRYNPPPIGTPQVERYKNSEDTKNAFAICPEPEQVLKEASFRPWWKAFKDPVLDELEYQAIKGSPKVAAAVARLEQAMAFYGITESSLFPEIDLVVSATRQRISPTGGNANAGVAGSILPGSAGLVTKSPSAPMIAADPSPACLMCPPAPAPMCACPPPPTPKPVTHLTSLGVLPVLTYDLDIWGKNWQATQSSWEQVKAEQEDVQNTLLQLTTAVADSYLQVRTYDSELDILERTFLTRQHNFDLNTTQFQAGLINELAVDQSKSDLENVAAEIEATSKKRSSMENLLAQLVGQPASTFTLEKQKTLPHLPEIPPGLPSAMLQRRPDIRQSLNLIESARLNVGVAKTEYFPDFTITLDYGFVSGRANKLFDWKSHVWLAAVEAITPLYTAGRISSQIDQAIAQYKQAVASHLDITLTAFQQVEDALFNIEATHRELKHLALDVIASQKAYNVADKRYRMGLENYILVVNTERTLLDVERTEIQVTREQFSNTISLINSLGGYWNNNEELLSYLNK